MKLSLAKRLYASFGFVILMLVVSGALVWQLGRLADQTLEAGRNSTVQTAALADAQSALWELRWGVAQMIALTDDAARAKVLANSPRLREEAEKALAKFESLASHAEERKSLKTLRETFTTYVEGRARWGTAFSEGKIEEAAKIRAEVTTPVGAATVKGFAELIEMQRKNSAESFEAANQSIDKLRTIIVVFMLLAAVISLAIVIWVVKAITRQLGGEPDYASTVAREIAAGNLAIDVQVRAGDNTSLLFAMKGMRDSLAQVVGEVRQSTDTIATASSQIAAGNQDLSSRTEQQASSLEETAASMEELTSTVKQNAENARQVNQLALTNSGLAARGGAVVAQVVHTMSAINTSSKKIVDIIGVIDSIAFQTNILALNAAVEAARAGEQGRGFAVVASEVRSLAQRSAAAAKEIKTLIGDSVDKVAEGSQQAIEAGKTMTEIVGSAQRVADIMAKITAASQEQTQGIEQVNQAIAQMDQVTQQNAALVEEAAAAAASLQEQAGGLLQVVSVFKLGSSEQQLRHAAPPRPTAVRPNRAQAKQPPAIKHAIAAPQAARTRSSDALPATRLAAATSTTGAGEWEEF
ncbi:methyl-accepting chemotaxis protein [Polaromonas sp. CG_9.11]|uniref:methyl-accepting chemotaxis protein n=1 Tax=Polaromonas sp. CG_9.11 TaxID=2787730 RepID=UPI0018CA1C0C|nr:methyl-accepting chemotaxis protein [Polaromonas sp. CG_9.11]MBG6077594.1 methyl-accepting chemotaxis protein [Polaromonas sp. CG_9.11]